MATEFSIPVRFTGKVTFKIRADSKQDAIAIAHVLARDEVDFESCGLEDVVFEVNPDG